MEKALYTPYAKNPGELLKNCLHSTQRLVSKRISNIIVVR